MVPRTLADLGSCLRDLQTSLGPQLRKTHGPHLVNGVRALGPGGRVLKESWILGLGDDAAMAQQPKGPTPRKGGWFKIPGAEGPNHTPKAYSIKAEGTQCRRQNPHEPEGASDATGFAGDREHKCPKIAQPLQTTPEEPYKIQTRSCPIGA